MSWLDTAGVGVFGAVAAYYVVRLAVSFVPAGRTSFPRPGSAGRLCDASHAAMGAGMALMFSPQADLVPTGAGIAVFTVLGIRMVGIMIANGVSARVGTDAGGDGGHGAYVFNLTVGCAAMVYMYAAGHGGAAVAELGAAHGVAGGSHQHGAAMMSILGWLFSNYFVVAVASGGFRLGAVDRHGNGRGSPSAEGAGFIVRPLTSLAARHWSEVAMAAGMAAMLIRTL